jgi:hypothetical protein
MERPGFDRIGLDRFEERACEEVDACVFSGDILASLNGFKEYLGRWNRAVAERERTNAEEKQEP